MNDQTEPAVRTAPAAVVVRPEPPRPGIFARFIQILFAPITWLVRPLVFRIGHDKGNPKVHFTSFSTLLYLWPVMVVGAVGSFLLTHNFVHNAEVLGWVWITIVILVMICLGSDLNRNKTLAVGALVVILWLGGALLNDRADIPVLSHIYNYFDRQDVRFDPGTARVMSVIIGIILIGVIIIAWFDGRYEITTMEITHRRFLFTSDSLPRSSARVKRDWRDLTEVFFGLGAGDLVVIDANKNELMRIPNIPFLWFFRHDVDHILEVLATTDVDETVSRGSAEDSA